MNFENFNPAIGIKGYYETIRLAIFPQSTPASVDYAALKNECRTYPKGSIFSRVRKIQKHDIRKFILENIGHNEFLPPKRNVAQVPIGRFNNQGERKLYLADHPYVALQECGIGPGDYFLYSYFSLKTDIRLIEVSPYSSEASKMIYDIFQSKDHRFYPVINLIYNKLLKNGHTQGIAYKSAKVKEWYQDDIWGEVKSTINIAIEEENIPSANLVAGWLAQCDKNYHPIYWRMFRPLSPKKKHKITSFLYRDNKARFISEKSRAMDKIQHLQKISEKRIESTDKYSNEKTYIMRSFLK